MSCAVIVAGCGSSVSKDTFKQTLVEDANLSEPVARCVTDELYRRLDDEQIQRVYREERAALTQAERNAVADAAVLCVSETPADVPPPDGG